MTPFYLHLKDDRGDVLIAAASIDYISNAKPVFSPHKTKIIVNGCDVYVLEDFDFVFRLLQQGCRELEKTKNPLSGP